MKLTEKQMKQMIRQAVQKQLGGSLVNEGPRHIGTIQKGMAAGKQAAGQRTGGGRYAKGEMAQQAKDSAKKAKQRKDMSKRFKSASDYLKKVFGDSAKVYSNNTVRVNVGDSYTVNVGIRSQDSIAGSVFIVEIAKGNKTIDSQELGIGIGAKQKIARFIKKVIKQVQAGKMAESKTHKVSKSQLKEMVRKVVREQLQERHAFADPDGGMSQDEIAQHLQKSREEKKRKDAQRKRAGAKKSMRGMSVECGPDMDQDRKPHKLAVLFADDEERDLEEGMYESSHSSMDDFCAAYIEAALGSSTDESDESGGNPLDDNYSVDDIDEDTLRKMQKDCDRFQKLAGEMIEGREERAGHDFWLTRNGHGAGFWDGDWPEHGDALTELSKNFGEVWLYVGDDGLIHQM